MTRQTTKRRRWIAWTVGLVVVAGLLVVALRPSPVPVDLATVARGELRVTLDHEGKASVHDRYVVSAPLAGRVLRIEAEPGDHVVGGTTVVAEMLAAAPPPLDARTRAEAAARVRTAEAQLDQARAALQQVTVQRSFADTELARTRTLYEAGAVAKSALDSAQTAAAAQAQAEDQARAAVSSAEHGVEAARAATLEPAQVAAANAGQPVLIHAPVTGVVLERLHESEAVVPAGEPLLELADPADLEVVADYLSTDAVKMKPGMPAIIDRWGGGEPLNGRVRLVEPYGFLKVSALGVEEQRVNVHIALEDPRSAWASLGDGYRVEAHVVIADLHDVVKAPASALFHEGAGWAVFVDVHGRAALRAVMIGDATGDEAEVTSGLSTGDQVILHPSDAVKDGVRVAPRS